MREDWLTHQIQLLEAQVRAKRQRLHEERQRKAQQALIALSLPELLGEISDEQDEPYPSPDTTAARMN